MNLCAGLVSFLLCMTDELKIYHWRTRSHARHQATCQALKELASLVDTLVETYIGRYERPDFPHAHVSLAVRELSEENAAEVVQKYANWMRKRFPEFVHETDTDLLNIRDEILGCLDRLSYQFTLS